MFCAVHAFLCAAGGFHTGVNPPTLERAMHAGKPPSEIGGGGGGGGFVGGVDPHSAIACMRAVAQSLQLGKRTRSSPRGSRRSGTRPPGAWCKTATLAHWSNSGR